MFTTPSNLERSLEGGLHHPNASLCSQGMEWACSLLAWIWDFDSKQYQCWKPEYRGKVLYYGCIGAKGTKKNTHTHHETPIWCHERLTEAKADQWHCDIAVILHLDAAILQGGKTCAKCLEHSQEGSNTWSTQHRLHFRLIQRERTAQTVRTTPHIN